MEMQNKTERKSQLSHKPRLFLHIKQNELTQFFQCDDVTNEMNKRKSVILKENLKLMTTTTTRTQKKLYN